MKLYVNVFLLILKVKVLFLLVGVSLVFYKTLSTLSSTSLCVFRLINYYFFNHKMTFVLLSSWRFCYKYPITFTYTFNLTNYVSLCISHAKLYFYKYNLKNTKFHILLHSLISQEKSLTLTSLEIGNHNTIEFYYREIDEVPWIFSIDNYKNEKY